MMVQTIKGMVERSQLRIEDHTSETEDARKIETRFFLGNELVRQDVTVSIWRGLDASGAQGDLNG